MRYSPARMATAIGEETDYDDQPDFSQLPDIVWVKILKFLDLPTRNKVSQTCRALHDAFYHPSLWHTVKIILLGSIDQHAQGRPRLIMADRYFEMAKRFGAYFQDLTLKVIGFVDKFPMNSKQVILELAKRCRLETLTLDVGIILSKGAFGQNVPRKVHLDVLVELVANAFRLKNFCLKSWPLHRGIQNVDVLEALKANHKLKNLERLDLFWQSAEGSTWATLNAILPSPDTMKGMINHFTNLQYLALRSTMLRQDIIEEMAKPGQAPLKRLAVLVTYSRYYEHEGVPEISSTAWKNLHRSSPELEVEITIVTRMPFIDLAAFMKPEIPVSSIGFMKYSSLRVEDLESIRDKFSKTLHKFLSLVEDDGLDGALKDLVSKSPNLTYLVFHGMLYRQTVLDLAAMKGTSWYRFDVPEKAIKFGHPPSTDEFDEEIVVVKTAGGEFQLAGMLRASQDDDDEQVREQHLKDVISQVSQLLDKKWRPLNMTLVEAKLLEGVGSVLVPEHVLQAASAPPEQESP